MPSDALPDDPKMLQAMLLAERAQNERLPRSSRTCSVTSLAAGRTLPEDQMLLGWKTSSRRRRVMRLARAGDAGARQAGVAKRRANRGALPAHLPRIETTIDIDEKTCRCCQGALHRIGEDKSERLDIVPAQFRVWSRSGRNTLAGNAKKASCKPSRPRG